MTRSFAGDQEISNLLQMTNELMIKIKNQNILERDTTFLLH